MPAFWQTFPLPSGRRETLVPAFWQKNQSWLTPLILLLLPVGLFAVMIVIPIIQSILTSFYDWDGTGEATWVGFANYVELFGDPQFLVSLKNNIIWILMFLLAPVFGLTLALFLNQPLRELRFIKAVFFLPWSWPQSSSVSSLHGSTIRRSASLP